MVKAKSESTDGITWPHVELLPRGERVVVWRPAVVLKRRVRHLPVTDVVGVVVEAGVGGDGLSQDVVELLILDKAVAILVEEMEDRVDDLKEQVRGGEGRR